MFLTSGWLQAGGPSNNITRWLILNESSQKGQQMAPTRVSCRPLDQSARQIVIVIIPVLPTILISFCLSILNMASLSKLVPLLLLLIWAAAPDPIPIKINEEAQFTLQGEGGPTGEYTLKIPSTAVPELGKKWYVFVMAEPSITPDGLLGTPSKIQLKKVSQNGNTTAIKQCQINEDLDVCFLKDSQFDYKVDKILVLVSCPEACKYSLFTEVDQAYPLSPNVQFTLDFETTAYSKIFSLNLTGQQFDELRITVMPDGFLRYSEPILLIGNWGNEVPTHEKHDMKGLHIWNDGQGIFLHPDEIKNETITLVLSGPEENVLNLKAETRKLKEPPVLQNYIPYFDEVKADEKRSYIIQVSQDKVYSLKALTFTGALSDFKFWKVDSSGSQSPFELAEQPLNRYGEVEYHLSRQLLKKYKVSKLRFEVSAKKDTTFLLGIAEEDETIGVLHEYISQSSQMEEGQVDEFYLKVYELIEHSKKEQKSRIEIILGNVKGKIKPYFFRCKETIVYHQGDTLQKCEVPKDKLKNIDALKKSFQVITPSEKDVKAGIERYWFTFDWKELAAKDAKDMDEAILQMVIAVENVNQEGEKESSYEIQFKNKDRIYLLREAEYVPDRVMINEKRHYKFQINSEDVQEIRVHVTQISGAIKAVGSLTDPRVNKDFEEIYPTHNIIYFPHLDQNKKLKEVFLEVEGVENALYSLTTQVIRKSEADPTDPDAKGYNELIVREEIPYEYVLNAKEKVVFQLRSTQPEFLLIAKASAPVDVCFTENLTQPPFAPNCEVREKQFTTFSEVVYLDKGNIVNIGVGNPSDKNVTLKIMMSKKAALCETAPLNSLMEKFIGEKGKDDDGVSEHCLQFLLNRVGAVEVTVKIDSADYAGSSVEVNINGAQIVKMTSPVHHFKSEEIKAACGLENEHSTFCYLQVSIKNVSNTKVHVFVQYTDDAVRLLEGYSHSVHAQMIKPQPRKFYYPILNAAEVNILLENIVGEYRVYAALMTYAEYQKNVMNNIKSKDYFPNETKNMMVSANPFFHLEQLMTVDAGKIKDVCLVDGAIDCVLLMSVGITGDSEVLEGGKFSIMASQQRRELLEKTVVTGYLTKKSAAFFTFQNSIPNGSLLVEVSNNNRKCLDLYMLKGPGVATSSVNDKEAKGSNTLVLESAEKETYSLTLVANEDCAYSLQIFTSKKDVSRIKKGVFSDIELAEGQEKNLLFQNMVNETFKILSMHESGEVVISVKPVSYQDLNSELEKKPNEVKGWVWSNKDSVRVDNFDAAKNAPHEKYCVNCFYLINIKAQRKTKASVVIPTPGLEIPLKQDFMIKDLLLKNESSTYRIFTESEGKFEILVQHGKLNISIYDSDKGEKIFSKIYEQATEAVFGTFKYSSTASYEYLRYSKIEITALEESYFSLGVVSSEDPATRNSNSLKYGIPEYSFLEKNKEKCFKGTIDKKKEEFLLSFSQNEKAIAAKIEVNMKIDGKAVALEKELSRNQMILQTVGTSKTLGKFDLCLKSPNDSLSVTVIQSSPVIYWAENTTVLVKNNLNMTFGSEGTNLIEVNECGGRAITTIFNEFGDLKSTNSIIKQRRKLNNIIEFYHYGAVFISATVSKGTYRWIEYNEIEGKGLGYDNYEMGWMRVLKTSDSNLEASAEPLKAVMGKKIQGKIESVDYQFFAAKEESELYSAMNCGEGEFITKNVVIGSAEANKQATTNNRVSVSVNFNIPSELKGTFSKYSYFLIGLKVVLQVTDKAKALETYRFFYPYQQVNREVLDSKKKPVVDEQSDYGGVISVIGWGIFLIVGIFVVRWAYLRWCKRCFSRRTRMQDSMGIDIGYNEFTASH